MSLLTKHGLMTDKHLPWHGRQYGSIMHWWVCLRSKHLIIHAGYPQHNRDGTRLVYRERGPVIKAALSTTQLFSGTVR